MGKVLIHESCRAFFPEDEEAFVDPVVGFDRGVKGNH